MPPRRTSSETDALLKRAEARFRGLLDAAPDALVVVGPDGLIQLVNAQVEKLFGYRREDLLGQPVEVLVPPRYRARHPDHRGGYLRDPNPRPMGAGLDLFAVRKDGTEFPAEISLAPMRTPEGVLVTAAIRDVTERKVLERRTQEANRLKSEFLANMSHELRTPLNAVIGFTELLLSGKVGPLAGEQQEYLGDILTSSRHLLRLINDVLDLAKVESGKMEFRAEDVDLARLAGEVRDVLRGLAAAKRLRVESRVEVPSATVDPARAKQVLYNYLSNAIKFTPEGGRVEIRILPQGPDLFRIDVEDSGIGIAPENLGRLFVEFQQLDASTGKRFQGTGLGLSLTKRIVEAQGGRVEVRSTPGAGSTFSAILPRVMAGEPAPHPSAVVPRRDAPAVLVVEPDARGREWLSRELRGAGYAVEEAASGAEALSSCRERTFAAITVDPLLPDLDAGLLARIRATPDVPVIAVTTSAEAGRIEEFPLVDWLAKPVEGKDLLAALHRARGAPGNAGPVFVVDDDPSAGKLATALLAEFGERVEVLLSAEEALQAAEREAPSLVVLDLLMPGLDGFEFLALFREMPAGRGVPVVVWTVKDVGPEERARLRARAQAVVSKSGGGVGALVEELRPFLAGHRAAGVEP